MMNKLKSRKFLMCLAAFLASVGGSIGGIIADNSALTTIGMVCTMLSAAIYAACEAYVDGQAAGAKTTINNTTEQKVTTIKTEA